jgi:LysM repeat protein
MIKITKRILVELLVILAKFATLLKKMAVSLGSLFVLKPGRSVARLFFYKVVVKVYSLYYSTTKRLGWKGRESSGFRLAKEFSHILTITAVLLIVGFNFFDNTRAQAAGMNSDNTLLSRIVTAEFGMEQQDQLIEETFDYEQLQPIMAQNNLDTLANIKAQPRVERVLTPEAEVDVFAEADNNQDLAFVRPGQVTKDTAVARHDVTNYTVEDGDTISTIAEKFGIGVSTILWENDLNATSVIRPGDNLRILPVSGVMHQVARNESIKSLAAFFSVNEKDIVSANNLSPDQHLAVGSKLIIPGGKKERFVSFTPKTYSGVSVVRNIIEPVKKLIKPLPKSPKIGNKMTWPTVGYRITQYFTFSHFAIDIANHIGTPLYAADAGVVESAGWGRGYGNNIVVNHGGGKKTRYAHMNKFYVKKGDVVEKGEQLGQMGNTGWSTGPHIHFEVIINGVKYNPLNYVR